MRTKHIKPYLPVSVIIATYNRSQILKNSISCLCVQVPAPLEILVIDQSETVPDDVRDYLSTLNGSGKIRWIRQYPPNAQTARNRGIIETKGEVLLFLDDDIKCNPGLVAAHWKNYNDPSIVAVSGMILEPRESPTEKLPRRFYGPKIGWMYFPLNFGKRTECINLSSCNCSVRREVALKVGGFDENFRRTLFDDSDFSWRVHLYCRDRGLRIIHDPEACLTHLRVPTGGKRPGKINRHIVADAEAWENLLYFHLNHIGLEALRVIFQRYRWWVWHKKNILEPWWLMKAHYEMIKGLSRLLQALKRGPKLIAQDIV